VRDHALAGSRFYGEEVQRTEFAEATLSETHYPGGFTAEAHTHERAFLCFVLHGRYTESYGSGQRECGPFGAVFHPPGETHADRFHSPVACFNIELASPIGCDRVPAAALTPGSVVPFLAARLYVAFRRRDTAGLALTEELVLELEATSFRRFGASRRPPSWLPQVIERLSSSGGTTSIRSLAADLGLHPVYLARAFRRHLGCSPAEYQRRIRLSRASAHLTSSASASRVAAEAGFADQSHFHRMFTRTVGLSPGQWRGLVAANRTREVASVQGAMGRAV
jgi:AraC family transcriptional regulator